MELLYARCGGLDVHAKTVVVDGKPITGVAGYAGEVGHIPLNRTGISCRCGSVGCCPARSVGSSWRDREAA